MKYSIVTYGTAMGKHTRIVDPTLYETEQEASDVVDERAEIGDPAAREGRMRVEEAEDADE